MRFISFPVVFSSLALEIILENASCHLQLFNYLCLLYYSQVNGINLAEIEGGEVATTNLHSCNGPDFVLQLHFSLKQASVTKSPGK